MSRKFEAIISILDKASLPLMSIEEKMRNLGTRAKKTEVEIKEIGATSLLKSRIGQDLHAIGARLHPVGHAIHEHLEGPMEKVGGVVEKLVDAVPVLGSLGALGSAAGLIELVNKTSEATEQLSNLSKISGISTQQLQVLQFAAKDTGVSTDELARGMGRLNERLGKAALGQNKQLAALFQHLHVSLRNADGSVKSASQQLPVLMKALHDTHNPALRAAIVMQAFGRSGIDLLPFLDKGSKALAEQTKRWKEFGYTFTGSDMEGLEKFRHDWNDLETAMSGFISAVAADFAPVIAPIIKQMAIWVALNRGLISADLKAGLNWLETTIKNFHWTKFETKAGAAFKVIIQGAEAAAKIATELNTLINGSAPVPAHATVNAAGVRNPAVQMRAQAAVAARQARVRHDDTGVRPTASWDMPSMPKVPQSPALPKIPVGKHSTIEKIQIVRPMPQSPYPVHRAPTQSPSAPGQPPAPQKIVLQLHVKTDPGTTVTAKAVSGAAMPQTSLGHNGTIMELHPR